MKLLTQSCHFLFKTGRRTLWGKSSEKPSIIIHNNDRNLLKSDNPTVLLLGFGGAKKKHMEKYAAFYAQLGCPSLSYTGVDFTEAVPEPEEGEFYRPLFSERSEDGKELEKFRRRPMIIHSLSMNGARSTAKLYRWIQAENRNYRESIRGVFFDSCPCHLTPYMNAYGMMITRFNQTKPEWLADNLRISAFMPYALSRHIVSRLHGVMDSTALSRWTLYHYLKDIAPLPLNQLFIYSMTDNVINHKHIGSFIADQRAKGKNVISERFEDSTHVQHLLNHPVAYENAVRDFLELCEVNDGVERTRGFKCKA